MIGDHVPDLLYRVVRQEYGIVGALHKHIRFVVVVYHVTIVAIGHGLLKKFWPLVLGCVLHTAGSPII